MTTACRALVDHALGEWGLNRVEIRCATGNVRSRRIPERLGFTCEARLRRRLPPVVTGGPPADMAVYTMVAEEFDTSAAASARYTAFDSAGRPD